MDARFTLNKLLNEVNTYERGDKWFRKFSGQFRFYLLLTNPLENSKLKKDVVWSEYIMALSKKDKEILEQLKKYLVQALNDHMKIIKAFGSRVRGDAHEWSDLDVMIVVSQINPEIKEIISQIRYNVMWENNFRPLISLLLYSEEELKEASRSLMGKIEEEGVTIWQSA